MSTASTTISIDGYTFTITVASPVTPTPPPVPVPTPTPGPSTGVQAARVADLLETFGVNTFSSLDANSNVWGSWPADYSPASVIAAMNWLTNGSGLTMRGREYHYADRTAMQNTWLQQVTAATGSKFSLCVGAGGDVSNVPSMLTMAANPANPANNIPWLEGVNEPNTDFGSGPMPVATMQSVQSLLSPANKGVMGPSIVFGLPFPEGYITPAYVSAAQLTALNAFISIANGHFYPPRNPDVDDGSNRGGSFDDVVVGLKKVYGNKPLMITEWHPTLYNGDGHNGDEKLAAYLTPICLLSAFRLGVAGMWWYSLFDYGWNGTAPVYASGLFPKTGATAPRPAAWAIRAMFTLMADHGATKRTFTPGKLDYRVTGLPPPVNAASPHTGGQHALFQASDGKFCLVLWNSQLAPGGTKAPVTVTFGTPVASVSEFNVTTGDASALTAVQTVTHASVLVSQLDASVRVLVITP